MVHIRKILKKKKVACSPPRPSSLLTLIVTSPLPPLSRFSLLLSPVPHSPPCFPLSLAFLAADLPPTDGRSGPREEPLLPKGHRAGVEGHSVVPPVSWSPTHVSSWLFGVYGTQASEMLPAPRQLAGQWVRRDQYPRGVVRTENSASEDGVLRGSWRRRSRLTIA